MILKKKPVIILLLLLFCFCGSSWAEEYRIEPGDVLSFSVMGCDDMQIPELIVRKDGKITFPLAGEIKADGLSIAELTDLLRTTIQKYVHEPFVTINVVRFHTTRVYVLGEVARPGMYEIEKQHSLLDAIGIAGGYTKDAAKKKVFIIRRDAKQPIQANLLNLLERGDMSQNLLVNDGDMVYLSSNHRLDFARDILPFITGSYYIKHFDKS